VVAEELVGLVDVGLSPEKATLQFHQTTLGAQLRLVEATVAVEDLLGFTVEV
jgi:hypothetical protein